MDYQKITQKILDIYRTDDGFDETDFIEHLQDFFYLKLIEKTQVTKKDIAQIANFIWQEKFGLAKIETSKTENEPSYYDKKRKQLIDQDNRKNEGRNDNELPPIEVIIGGEKDTFLCELLSKFDELREDIQRAVIKLVPTEKGFLEAELLINKGLTEYGALMQQISGKKETIFEIQSLLNSYLAEIGTEKELSGIKPEFPEAKVIRLPPFLKK